MSKKEKRTIETDEDGKLKMSLEEFDYAFRALVARMPKVTYHADPSTFKTNPVTPGIGSRVIDADTWAKRWQKSAEDSATDWEERALTPSADPAARAVAANEKRKDRLAAAEKAEKWLKKMRNVKKEDIFDGIQGVGAEGYKAGITGKAAKTQRRIRELQPKVLALAQAIDRLSDKSDGDREKRMLAARRGMIAIGQGETISLESTRTPG